MTCFGAVKIVWCCADEKVERVRFAKRQTGIPFQMSSSGMAEAAHIAVRIKASRESRRSGPGSRAQMRVQGFRLPEIKQVTVDQGRA